MANTPKSAIQFKGGQGRWFIMFYQGWIDIISRNSATVNSTRCYALLLGLLSLGRNRDCIEVSLEEVAQAVGVNRRTIQRAIPDLEKLDILRYRTGLNRYGNTANYYQIIPPLAESPPMDKKSQGYGQKAPPLGTNSPKAMDKKSQLNSSRVPVERVDNVEELKSFQSGTQSDKINPSSANIQHMIDQMVKDLVNPATAEELARIMFEGNMVVGTWNDAYKLALLKTATGKTEKGGGVPGEMSHGRYEVAAGLAVGIIRETLKAGRNYIITDQDTREAIEVHTKTDIYARIR